MAEIRTLFGAPYSWWESIRRGGTGSPPLRWVHGPLFIQEKIQHHGASSLVNIEFLPTSLLIRINVQGKVFLLMGIKPNGPIHLHQQVLSGTDDRFNTCFTIQQGENVLCTLACRKTDFPKLWRQWNSYFPSGV